MIKEVFHKRYKAGLLPLTLAICLILSLFCAASIMFAYYNDVLWIGAKIRSQVERNVDSALEYWLASSFRELPFNSEVAIDLFGEQCDSVFCRHQAWGIMDRVSLQAQTGRFRSRREVIIGYRPWSEKAMSLYVSGTSSNPVTLVGDARIVGDAWVPAAGVKAGYYDRVGYSGKQLVEGDIHTSQNDLPPLSDGFLDKVKAVIQLIDSCRDLEKQDIPEKLYNPFSKNRLLFFQDTPIALTGQLKGQVMVVSGSEIKVTASAELEDVILIAPEIKFSSGFKGSVQAFATEQIKVDGRVNLSYPSALILTSEHNSDIDIAEDCEINGLVCSWGNQNTDGKVRIAKTAVINGQVITNGRCEHEGTLNGQLVCRQLIIQDASGNHLNFLRNGVVNVNTIPDQYLSFGVFEQDIQSPAILINL